MRSGAELFSEQKYDKKRKMVKNEIFLRKRGNTSCQQRPVSPLMVIKHRFLTAVTIQCLCDNLSLKHPSRRRKPRENLAFWGSFVYYGNAFII